MNEPKNAAFLGYAIGVHAPFLKAPATNASQGWTALLHMLEAHAAAVKAYKKAGLKGRIGVALDSEWTLPVDPEKDTVAAQRYIDYRLGSFADPLYFGQWPASVRERLEPTGELPPIPRELSEFLVENKPKTFFLNYYTAKYIWEKPGKRCGYGENGGDGDDDDEKFFSFFRFPGGRKRRERERERERACEKEREGERGKNQKRKKEKKGLTFFPPFLVEVEKKKSQKKKKTEGDGLCDLDERYESKDGAPVGPRADSTWLFVYPDGLRRVLDYVNKRYKPEEIWLSESGLDAPNEAQLTGDNVLDDAFRLDSYRLLIAAADAAVQEDGVPLTTYLAWSLTDGLEWQEGMTKRFGITYVDVKPGGSAERVPKASAVWLAKEFGTLPKDSKVKVPPSSGGGGGAAAAAGKEEATATATKKEEKKE